MWTEILTEDAAVVHVGGMDVLVPLERGMSRGRGEEITKMYEEQKMYEHLHDEVVRFGEELEASMELHELLAEHGVDTRPENVKKMNIPDFSDLTSV